MNNASADLSLNTCTAYGSDKAQNELRHREGKHVLIIGSSVSAMAISRNLSSAQIAHVMIGPPPNGLPKLGESMNPEGSTELENLFPEYRDCFHDKPRTTIAVGKYQVECDFGKLRDQRLVDTFLNTLSPGIHIPKQMIHIDRIRFDERLYQDIEASDYLEIINSKVSSLDHSYDTQSLEKVTLENGESFEPRFVFDCTNHARVIGRALHVPVSYLSQKQRVAFAHYHCNETQRQQQLWESGTNLLRIEESVDGVEGFAWCIPLGKYVSVGMTLNAAKHEKLSSADMMKTLEQAYKRRGLDFSLAFKKRSPIVDVQGQYFKHERAYGPNWVMVGGTYSQIWFMSGSGLGTALSCSAMAADFVKRPEKAGAAYQKYMDQFIKTHWPVDWFVNVAHEKTTRRAFKKNVNDWLVSNLARLTVYPQIRMRPWNNFLGDFASFCLQKGLVPMKVFRLEKFCPTHTLESREQMWNPELPSTYEKKRDVIVRLTETISGKRPIKYANQILHPRIKLWMGNVPFMGRWFWKAWVCYLREHSQVKNIRLELEDARLHQNVLHMKAGWYGNAPDDVQIEQRVQDVFGEMEVRDGRIVEIKTRKSNYTSLLGEEFAKPYAFLKLFFVISWWSLKNVREILKP